MKYPRSMTFHIRSVLAGEYDLPIENPRVVLDIGANVGAFTVWARNRWPNSVIYAYEPIPRNFKLLLENTKGIPKVMPINVAIRGNKSLSRLMFLGRNNCGEYSFFNLGEQLETTQEVRIIQANELPRAEVVKIDTEGCELEILRAMNLEGVQGIALECHRDSERDLIRTVLADFALIQDSRWAVNRSLMKFVR